MRMANCMAAFVAAALCVAPASAVDFQLNMTGSQEVPGPGDPDGSATGVLSITPATNTIAWNFTYSNIAAPTMMHIHTGAAGVAGPVLVNLGVATTGGPGTLIGSTMTSAANINAILQNPSGFYVNIHNTPFPAGAIRGQLTPDTTWKWVGSPGPMKDWTNPANWTGGNGGPFPNNPEAKVLLGDVIQEDTTIVIPIPITLTALTFGSQAHSYIIGESGGPPITFENPGLTPIKLATPKTNIICSGVLHSCLELSGVPLSSLIFKGPIGGVNEGPASIILQPVNVCEIILKAVNSFHGSVLANGGKLVLDASAAVPPGDTEGGLTLINAIPDDVLLSIGVGGTVFIGPGLIEKVGSLVLGGVLQPPGMYGDAAPGIDGGGFIVVAAPCPADLTGDGIVDGADLGALLGSWGSVGSSAADINGDGIVDAADLAILLGAWGPC